MVGIYPTVGCLVFLDKNSLDEAKRQVLISLQDLIPQNSWQQTSVVTLVALALIGGSRLQALVHFIIPQTGVFAFIGFDEDQIVHLARYTGLTITELLSPYVAAFETVPGSEAVGMGFELSPLTGMEDSDLKEAGISLLFVRNRDTSRWERREVLPMVGHYL